MTPEIIAAGSAASRWPARNDSSAALRSHICTIKSIATSARAQSMAVNPRFFRESSSDGSISTFTSQLDRHCSQHFPFALEYDPRKRARRRALKHLAVSDGEITAVAWTFYAVLFRRIVNRARQVRALLAIGDVTVFTGADQDARMLRIG